VRESIEETISTLKFADRAKLVTVVARPNQVNFNDDILVQKLQKEVQSLRELLAMRNRSLPTDVQKHLIRLQQENIKLKELAQNTDIIERLKLENTLMRLELQKMKELSENGNTMKSTDLSVRDNASYASNNHVRKSY